MNPGIDLGVIGGSGLYALDDLEQVERLEPETPFGPPSGPIVVGRWKSSRVAFLPRHGVGHRLTPTEVPYRANIFALKQLGVKRIVAVSAVGSLHVDLHPLDVATPDQFIDRTRHRPDSFFGDGLAAHVSLADPICERLRRTLAIAARAAGGRVHEGGSYLCMEGPQFSTRAESEWYRSMGAKVIGMTNMQEVRLCREAEICFASLCLVTDYDCWKTDEPPVTVDAIVRRLEANAMLARRTVGMLIEQLPPRDCSCGTALTAAIVTPREMIPARTLERLAPILARWQTGAAG